MSLIETIVNIIESMMLDMPDSSPWSSDQGWNSALRAVIERLRALEQDSSVNSDKKD